MQPLGPLLAIGLALAGAGGAPAALSSLRVKVVGPHPAVIAPVTAPADALVLYHRRCAACHGDNGRGDGPAAAGLMVAPRRFTDAFWQDSETDQHLAKAIVEGGFAVRRSSAMPPHPDLKERASALVAVVRSFRSPTGSIAVQAVRDNGEVIATVTAEADASGAAVVDVKALPPEAVALVGRVSGHADAICRVALPISTTAREALCAAELASATAPPTAPPPAPSSAPAVSVPPQEPR